MRASTQLGLASEGFGCAFLRGPFLSVSAAEAGFGVLELSEAR